MTKKEFVDLYFQKGEFTTKVDAEKKAMAFLATIEEVLEKGDEISFLGFGKFEAAKRAERTCINPQTKKPMKIAARKVAKFKPGKNLLEKMNPVVEKKAAKGKKKSK